MTPGLAPHNQALVDFIRINQPIGPMAVYTFCEGVGGNYSAFRKRLIYLKAAGWLISTDNASPESLWSVNPIAPTTELTPQAWAAAKAELVTGPVVPPRQHNVMAADVYKPKPATHRPGAMDYAAIPSHICGEIRPFKGGM